MTNLQSKQERAKDLILHEPIPDIEEPGRRDENWYAQPAIGEDVKTYVSDSSDSNPEPPEYLRRRA